MKRALGFSIAFLLIICGLALAQMSSSSAQTGPTVIRIATINLSDFGYGGSDCVVKAAKFDRLASILSYYDVVSCQEVMRASQNGQECYGCSGYTCHLDWLVQFMSSLSGQSWQYRLAGPHRYGTRYEYYVILYNENVVTYLGREGSAESLSGSPAFDVRPPFWVDFRSGNFDFTIIDYHAPSVGSSVSTIRELLKLDEFLDALQAADPDEQDLILAGDLNCDTPPLQSHCSCDCRGSIDFLILDPAFTANEWSPPCSTDTRLQELGLSDHPIVWATFDKTKADDD